MTVNEVLTECDDLKPSQYDDTNKLKWLSDIEGQIVNEIINTHEREEDVLFTGYDESSMDVELIVPEPYAQLYLQYLMSQIDYYNGETGRYVNSSTMFNQKYKEFTDYWNRTHGSTMPATMH